MTHPFNDTCPACRAAKLLSVTDPDEIDLLHSAGQHMLDYHGIRQRCEEINFNALSEEVTQVLGDCIFIEAPAPTTHH